jgi:hypothetical protein
MHDLLRLARTLRSDAADPAQTFNHRIRIGIIVAALILLLSLLG